jgi:P4 family phage/plasmid primase-like protien
MSNKHYSAANPCPVCGSGSKNCSITPDGLHLCGIVRSAEEPDERRWKKLGERDGWGLYRPVENRRKRRPSKQPQESPVNWTEKACELAKRMTGRNDLWKLLADALKLPVEALQHLEQIGYNHCGKDARGWHVEFTFPERDASGNIIGICTRWENTPDKDGKPKKACIKGSKRGLTMPVNWRSRDASDSAPLFIVEGQSDTLAMAHAGLCCVGRPGCDVVKFLPELLHDWSAERPIIVMGENDERTADNGKSLWPGRTGALKVAQALAVKLNRTIRILFPPTGYKDVRQFLTAAHFEAMPWSMRGEALKAMISKAELIQPHAEEQVSNAGGSVSNDAPDDPHLLAMKYLEERKNDTLRYWREDFYRWHQGAYQVVSQDDLRCQLAKWLRGYFVRLNDLELAEWKLQAERLKENGQNPPKRPETRKVKEPLLRDVKTALASLCRLNPTLDAPAWIDLQNVPDSRELVALRNGILHLPVGELMPMNPDYFNLCASPFDYNADAGVATEWLKFVHSVWKSDMESINTLQEWFGYLLTPDTRQQKILFLIGPPRSGKGTILRVLSGLVGEGNIAAPRLSNLEGSFGYAPLQGKSIALVSDFRLSNKADLAAVAEVLLSLSGEDRVQVERKFREATSQRLTTRFVLASNEYPRLADASNALVNRLIVLEMTESFLNREDHGLEQRLLQELPSILNWARRGWLRLQNRGHFLQPASGQEILEEMRDLASPASQFVRERCELDPSAKAYVDDLYRAWCDWCNTQHQSNPGRVVDFGRWLKAAAPQVRQNREGSGERKRFYSGIRLKNYRDGIDLD